MKALFLLPFLFSALVQAPLADAKSTAPPPSRKPAASAPSAKPEKKKEEMVAHGKKNNCVGAACMAMGHKDLARTFDQLRAKVNSGQGITDSQFREVVAKYGLTLHDFAHVEGKDSKSVAKFRDAVKRAVGNNEKDYFVNFGDHMEAISKGNKPDILLAHFQRSGTATIEEVSGK